MSLGDSAFLVPLDREHVRWSAVLRGLLLLRRRVLRSCPQDVIEHIWSFSRASPAYCATFTEAQEVSRRAPYAHHIRMLKDWTLSDTWCFSSEDGDDGLVIDGDSWALACPDGSALSLPGMNGGTHCIQGSGVSDLGVTLRNVVLRVSHETVVRNRQYLVIYFEDAKVTLQKVTFLIRGPVEYGKLFGGQDVEFVIEDVKVVASNQ